MDATDPEGMEYTKKCEGNKMSSYKKKYIESECKSLLDINKIEDVEELRRRLIDMKTEHISLQNREAEYLRTQEETALLFQQTMDELKGAKVENKELRKELSKYKDRG